VQTTIEKTSLSDFLLILFEKMKEKNVRKISGRTKLQKLIFIIAREFKLPQKFDYFLYTYGPYSSKLQGEIDTLITFRLMREEVSRKRDYLIYEYSLTRKGSLAAKEILNEINKSTLEQFDKMAERATQLNKMPLPRLINDAYKYFNEKSA